MPWGMCALNASQFSMKFLNQNVSGIHHLLVILRCCTNLFNWFVHLWIYELILWCLFACQVGINDDIQRWSESGHGQNENLGLRSRWAITPLAMHFLNFRRSRYQLQVAEAHKRLPFLELYS